MDVFAIVGFVFGTTASVMISAIDKRMRALTDEVAELRRRFPDNA